MKNRIDQRRLRHQRLRQRVKGTAARPRMSVCISNRNIFVQFIDDDAMTTLASASTIGRQVPLNLATARLIGQNAAEAALAKGIARVVVDRGGFRYHGRVREIVEAAVAAGLSISDKARTTGDEAQTTEETK
jgi:large subunit ribosomal protein L18